MQPMRRFTVPRAFSPNPGSSGMGDDQRNLHPDRSRPRWIKRALDSNSPAGWPSSRGVYRPPPAEGCCDKRLEAVKTGEGIDWAGAKALGLRLPACRHQRVRLSGRMWAAAPFQPAPCGAMRRADHPVEPSESGTGPVLRSTTACWAEARRAGFEYGYAVTRPQVLSLWEAQLR